MNVYTILLLLSFCAISSAQQKTSAQFVEGKRQMKIIEEVSDLADSALAYISSCESSTPLSAGFGALPSATILNYRDLVATHPITIIRLNKSKQVADKSGIKSEPPLNIIDITLVHLETNKIQIFAHTELHGHLVQFGKPSKDAELRLHAIIKTTQEAQQDAP